LNVDLNVLGEEVATQNRNKAILEKRVVALEKEKTELLDQLTTVTSENTSLSELNRMLGDEISEAKKDIDAVKQKRDNLVDSLDVSKYQLKQLKSSLEETTSVNASLKNELDNVNVNNKNLSEEVKSLKDIVKVLTSSTTRLEKGLATAQDQITALSDENADLLSISNRELAAKDAKIDNLVIRLKRQKKKLLKELNNSVSQNKVDSERTLIQLEQAHVQLALVLEENDQLKKDTDLWKQREQSLPKELKRLQDVNLL